MCRNNSLTREEIQVAAEYAMQKVPIKKMMEELTAAGTPPDVKDQMRRLRAHWSDHPENLLATVGDHKAANMVRKHTKRVRNLVREIESVERGIEWLAENGKDTSAAEAILAELRSSAGSSRGQITRARNGAYARIS
jgi:hypothetical protein